MRGVRCKTCEEIFIQRLHAGEVSAGCCALLRTKKQLTTVRGSFGDSPMAWGASSARKIRANLLVLLCENVQKAEGWKDKSSNE